MIYDLTGKKVEGGEPPVNDELVKELEKFVALAKAGEIVAGAYVFVYDNNTVSEGWCVRDPDDTAQAVAQLQVLNLKLTQNLILCEVPDEPEPPAA